MSFVTMESVLKRFFIVTIVLFSYSATTFAQLTQEQCNKKGKLKIKIKDYQGAMQYFEFGLIDNPKSPILYNNIGNIYFIKKHFQKAEQHYSIAINNDIENSTLYVNRALTRMSTSQYNTAINDLKKSISINPKNHFAQSLLAQCFVEKKEYQKGLEYINEAIDKSKDHFQYYITRSKCVQYLNNELLAALKDIDTAIELAPDRAELFIRRAEIRSQVGDIAGSKADNKMAKSLNKMDFILDSEKQPVIFL